MDMALRGSYDAAFDGWATKGEAEEGGVANGDPESRDRKSPLDVRLPFRITAAALGQSTTASSAVSPLHI